MLQNNELYQLKVDVGMLNTKKNYFADILSVSPSSEQINTSSKGTSIPFHFYQAQESINAPTHKERNFF